MIKTFTITQQKAIEEKKEQLQKIIAGTLKPKELAEMITERRLNWLEENKNQLNKFSLENAYRFLIYNHMKVENGISMEMVSENLLRIECRNFCLYLEASKILNLDTRFVCKEVGEPSLVLFFKKINPQFHFSRDYNTIRPYSDFCLELLKLEERK